MELVRFADRPDVRALRSQLDEFPEFMTHNAMGSKYWGRLYDEFPAFQLALLDGGRLVAEVHALSVPVDGDELPAGWDEAFERGMEAGGGNVLSLLAISVAGSRRGEGLATTLIAAAREAAATAGLESVIAAGPPDAQGAVPADADRGVHDVASRGRGASRSLDPASRARRRADRAGGAAVDADRGSGRRLGAMDADASSRPMGPTSCPECSLRSKSGTASACTSSPTSGSATASNGSGGRSPSCYRRSAVL